MHLKSLSCKAAVTNIAAVLTELRLLTAFRCPSKQTPAVHIMIGMDLPSLITMQLLKHSMTLCILSTTLPAGNEAATS